MGIWEVFAMKSDLWDEISYIWHKCAKYILGTNLC